MNKRKLKVIVCGTRFGQFYLEALTKCKDSFEIAGILAQGSERSIECANHYGIRLYKNFEELPEDIDLACVVVGSSVFGGNGTELSKKFLRKKIPVIQEQPIHQDEIRECIQLAMSQGVYYTVGDLYVQTASVQNVITALNELQEQTSVSLVEMSCASQVLFPALHILLKMFPSAGNLGSIDVLGKDGPFSIVRLKAGQIPVLLKVWNEIDGTVNDRHMVLLQQITVWTNSGCLILPDTQGPLLWKSAFVMPDRTDIPWGLLSSAPDCLNGVPVEVLVSDNKQKLAEKLNNAWPEAIAYDLEFIKKLICNEVDRSIYERYLQEIILCANRWKAVTDKIGYPELKSAYGQGMIPVQLLKYCFEEKSKDVYTKEELEKSIHIMDDVCLQTMMQSYYKKSIFLKKEEGYTLEELCIKLEADKKFKVLMKIWLNHLQTNCYLKRVGDKYYRLVEKIDTEEFERRWEEAEKYWSNYLGPANVCRYFRENARKINALIEGRQIPTLLLFPEGKTELADALYRSTTVAKYLNGEVAQAIEEWMKKNQFDKLKVLEIGAGTGATTHNVLKVLEKADQKEYIFSDLSQYFLQNAKQVFGTNDCMKYQLLDIDEDFETQNIRKGEMEIIIAAGVINNARDTAYTMRQIVDCLRPGGIFLMIEAVKESLEIMISQAFMMTLPEDIRKEQEQVFYTKDDWRNLLNCVSDVTWVDLPDEQHPKAALGQALFIVKKGE